MVNLTCICSANFFASSPELHHGETTPLEEFLSSTSGDKRVNGLRAIPLTPTRRALHMVPDRQYRIEQPQRCDGYDSEPGHVDHGCQVLGNAGGGVLTEVVRAEVGITIYFRHGHRCSLNRERDRVFYLRLKSIVATCANWGEEGLHDIPSIDLKRSCGVVSLKRDGRIIGCSKPIEHRL
jgi:hypothetical protein